MKKIIIALTILTVGFLSACKKDKTVAPSNLTFEFQMNHLVNNMPVEFDNIKYTNSFGNNFSVSTLKYFVSDFTLHKASGDVVLDHIQYVDGKITSTTSFTKTTELIADETITGVSFVFGLSDVQNQDGIFTNAPESLMEWPLPLGGGYHYMKFEGKYDSSGTTKNFQCHTGPTNGVQYFIKTELPNSSFIADGNKKITIDINLDKWFSTPNSLDLNTVSMIMGNPSMQEKLKANGADVFALGKIE